MIHAVVEINLERTMLHGTSWAEKATAWGNPQGQKGHEWFLQNGMVACGRSASLGADVAASKLEVMVTKFLKLLGCTC